MAGRVLRDSKGRYKGSTKGWGKGAGSVKNPKRNQVVRHTAKQAHRAGLRGAVRVTAQGAKNGLVGAASRAAVGAAVTYRISGSPKRALIGGGAVLVTGAVGGVVQARPVRQYRASASASAALGMANRKAGADARIGVSRKASMSSTYRAYNKGGRAVRAATRI